MTMTGNKGIRVGAKAVIIENESILLIEYRDENGLHYNLPGGGVEPGESVKDAVKREAMEEAAIDVEVGELLSAIEYEPQRNDYWAGDGHSIYFIFECKRNPNTIPVLPDNPDPHQTGVRWIKISNLKKIELLPHISEQLIEYYQTNRFESSFMEEPISPEQVTKYLLDD